MISDRKQYIGIKNNIVFELFQFLFMLEWILACISRFSAHIPTSFSVFMPNICCLDKLDNKHYAYRLIMMWEYGQKNEKYWPGSIPAHIRIGKVLNVVIFDTNNCLFCSKKYLCKIWNFPDANNVWNVLKQMEVLHCHIFDMWLAKTQMAKFWSEKNWLWNTEWRVIGTNL